MVEQLPVKVSVLELLEKGSRRYSDLVKELGRPDKTVYVTLGALTDSKFIEKNEDGRYSLTNAGRQELERIRFVRVAQEEDDLEIIRSTRNAIALGRCYDLLSDLRALLARTLKKSANEDRRRVREKQLIVRNLLLKYNPSLKQEELVRNEMKEVKIGLTELVTGGIWWGKRFIKWGFKDRYSHLLNLANELPAGPVKDEIFSSLALFKEVGGRLDSSLKELQEPTERSAESPSGSP